jgi:hypothetical protein
MFRFAFPAAIMLAMSISGSAQWFHVPVPDTPRTADGRPDLSAPAPKTANDKPDLSGIWQLINPGRTGGEGRGGLRFLLPQDFKVPVQPWAKALWDRRYEVDMGAGRPSERCLPHIVPDALFFGPFKLVPTPRLTIILEEEFNHYRQIHVDGRKHPVDPEPAWYGYSVGAWDGDTFVVDTLGFAKGSWEYGWLDDSGVPYTGALHTIERFRRIDFGHLHLDVTIEDRNVFTAPWTFAVNFQLQPDTELIETICQNERDDSHMIVK